MVNKMLFMGVLLAAAGGVGMWWMAAQKPPGEYIPVGFGEPTPAGIPMDVAVSMIMPKLDPPKFRNTIQWEEWIDSHFVCTDAAGEKLAFRRANFSKSIPDAVAGTPEFFITTYLKPGARYTIEYAPVLAEPRRVQYGFTAPSGKQAGERVMFTDVE